MPRPAFAYPQIAQYLCDEGIQDLNNGDVQAAEDAFNRALIAEPGYPPAIYYLGLIGGAPTSGITSSKQGTPAYSTGSAMNQEQTSPAYRRPAGLSRQSVMENALDQAKVGETFKESQEPAPSQAFVPATNQGYSTPAEAGANQPKKIPNRILLNDPRLSLLQPIQIEEGKYIIITGSNITRFLVVQPDLLYAEKVNDNEVSVTAKGRGLATIIIWDDSGRTSLECTGIMPIPETPTLEETMLREEASMGNFKLRYNVDWYSYYTGNRLGTIERSSNYSYIHSLWMNGASPYGLLDTGVTYTTLPNTTDMTYVTAGITNGSLGPFKGWNLRAGDYNPYLDNLAMSGEDLRGVYLYSPAFGNKLNYSVFWGRESGGRFGTLSMIDFKSLHSFISGMNIDYTPTSWQDYKVSVLHGWGRDRQDFLRDYAYDFTGKWNFGKFGYSYEVANDTKNFAQVFTGQYNGNNLYTSLQLRDIDKEFVSIDSTGWRQGEFGALYNVNWRPTDKLTYTQRLDVYRDRLYPAEDNPLRYNEDLDAALNYKVDPLTNVEVSYTLQNDLGKLAATRYWASGLGVNRLFSFFGKEISFYSKYTHQDNNDFSAPILDYRNDKFFAGIRFSLIGSLYYYFNREINWLTQKTIGGSIRPNVTEQGLDWYDRIGTSPFWGQLRFTWRDEENADAPLSFLAGEDYIEGYGELSFRPANGQEIYASARVRNIWKEVETATSRVEASFNVGMKLLWDTGIRWDAVSAIQGYVFKDYNANGLMDRDEPPVFGVKVWLGKKQSQLTDELGYFRFPKVRGKMAYVTLDTGSLPPGYVLTVPVTQEIPIANAGGSRVYFGVTSRSELRGLVFEDVNEDGQYSMGEKGIPGITITLDGAKSVITGVDGSYVFPQASPGEHELTADLNTIPVYYLPLVPLKKKFPLEEGGSSVWNIPLRKIQK